MLVNPGEILCFGGKDFTIGGEVWANDNGIYAGLLGTITEIRNGKEKETCNDPPEIYCSFKVPVGKIFIAELERRFSEQYGRPVTLGEIALDSVVMAPDMLEPVAGVLPQTDQRHYVLSAFIDDNTGTVAKALGISDDISVLLRLMHTDILNHTPISLVSGTFEPEHMRFEFARSFTSCADALYALYMIAPIPVYQALKGEYPI